MEDVLRARERIYDHVQDSLKCGWYKHSTAYETEVYCIAKDTIQDTSEALMTHRDKDFTDDIYLRYIEYYGVLQAVYMQQDAIEALYNLYFGKKAFASTDLPNWNKLRELRNVTVGHPVGRKKRLNRNIIGYDCVQYSVCPSDKISDWKSTDVNLADLIDTYENEASNVLKAIADGLESDCATKHFSDKCRERNNSDILEGSRNYE